MIPQKLTIKGLYSYQQEHTIDFTRLAAGRLFGIFGPVGSGKSAILEAISFALYGESERLNSQDKRSYNMMNLKSPEMLVRFEFLAGANLRDRYLFEVEGKRQKKNFDKIGTLKRRQFRLIDGEWQPQQIKAEDILGLSYQNFRRTTIIPQGQFQEFLQLGEAERTRMLKEIFQLGRFDLFNKAGRLERANQEKRQLLNGHLMELGEVSPERIAEVEQQAAQCRKALEELEREGAGLEEQAGELSALKDLFERRGQAERRLAELQAQRGEVDTRRKNLQVYLDCREQFGPLLERHDEAQRGLQSRSEEMQARRRRQEELAELLRAAEKQFTAAGEQYRLRDTRQAEIAHIEKIAEMRTKQAELESCQKKLTELQQQDEELGGQLSETESELQELRGQRAQLQKEMADVSELAALQKWYTTDAGLTTEAQGLRGEEERLQSEQERTETLRRELLGGLPGVGSAAVQGDLFETSAGVDLSGLRQAMQEQLAGLEKELQHLQVQAELQRFAGELHPGEPCPLCGATEHPQILHAGSVAPALAAAAARLEKLRNEEKSLIAAEAQLAELDRGLSANRSKRQQVAAQIEELRVRREAHQKAREKLSGKKLTREETDAALEKAAGNHARLAQLDEEEKRLQAAFNEQSGRRRRLIEQIQELQRKEAELTAVRKSREAEVPAELLQKYAGIPPDELERARGKIQQEVEESHSIYLTAEADVEKLRRQSDTLSGELSAGEADLQERRLSFQKLEENLERRVEESHFASIDQVRQTLAAAPDVAAEQKFLSDYESRLQAAVQESRRLQEEIGGRSYDAAEHQKVSAEIARVKQQQGARNRELGGLEKELKTLKADLETRKSLLKELEETEKRGQNIALLRKLFTGDGFVNYVSSIYLQDLCQTANLRFSQLTRRQLQLEISPDNSFEVRDFLNDGQLRSVKTLSGGQTFQAALSLALALADNLAQRSQGAGNFFFLDEGFGTLDRDSLRLVFEALKALRKENRIVGIISHVDDLQEEIDVYLRIRRDEEKGSIIVPSWSTADGSRS